MLSSSNMRGALFAFLIATVLWRPRFGGAEVPAANQPVSNSAAATLPATQQPLRCQPRHSMPLQVYLPGWYDNQQHHSKHWWGEPLRKDSRDSFNGQDREDEYAYDNFFNQMLGGTYLEMGGLDGIKFSNSWWFHRELAWRGLLIEPNSEMYPFMVKNRPNDINVHSAVCSKPGKLHWVAANHSKTATEVHDTRVNSGAVSGIYELMPKSLLDTHWPHIKSAEGLPEITCLPLKAILGKLGIFHVNFFSLDVEGAELSVLKSVDFSCFSFDVMCAESKRRGNMTQDPSSRRRTQELIDFMTGHGYKHHGSALRSEWFVRDGFKPSSHNGTL